MKKYVFKEIDGYAWGSECEKLVTVFEEMTEKGYCYHSYLPGNARVSNGSYDSTILIFEKDIEEENNDF